VPFGRLKKGLACPSCGSSLENVVEYPGTFLCPDRQHTGSYSRPDRTIPPADRSVVVEFWNPYDD
jgi:hypothetical protein